MKILTALLVFVAASATAGTITVSGTSRATTAAQDAAWTARKNAHNAELCATRSLPRACSQAAYTAAGGEGTIYSGANATQDYALDRIFELIAAVERQVDEIERGDAVLAWRDATPAQRAAACTALGKTSACR